MKCADCGKEIDNTVIAYCEKCEKYYCMDCASNNHHHINLFSNNRLRFYPVKDGVKGKEISVGVWR